MNEEEQRKKLIEWLGNTYAMEKQIIEVLRKHKEDAKDYPEMVSHIEQHIRESEEHANMVKQANIDLGGETSGLKSTGTKIIGRIEGMLSEVTTRKDKVVKNAIEEFATENLEIANYQAIYNAAKTMGETKVMRMCTGIIADESTMANWIQDKIPALVSSVFIEDKQD